MAVAPTEAAHATAERLGPDRHQQEAHSGQQAAKRKAAETTDRGMARKAARHATQDDARELRPPGRAAPTAAPMAAPMVALASDASHGLPIAQREARRAGADGELRSHAPRVAQRGGRWWKAHTSRALVDMRVGMRMC